jgi:hypothetical protein
VSTIYLGAAVAFLLAIVLGLAHVFRQPGRADSLLAALLFGFRISKHAKISRWDSPKLTHEQMVYAATDAWICREIYFMLLGMLRGKRGIGDSHFLGHPF